MDGHFRRFAALATAVALALTLLPAVASADATDEAAFVSLINQSRAAAGLAPLSTQGDLVSYARSHTAEMIAKGTIFHSTNAQLSSATSGWSMLGENVGMGPDPQVLHNAFMSSASHKANILGAFQRVGVGAERSPDGTLFVTVIFMQVAASTTTTTTATTTAPPPATTTTTTTTVPKVPTTTSTTQPETSPDETETAATGSPVTPVQPVLQAASYQPHGVLWALGLFFSSEKLALCVGPTHFRGICII